MHVSVTVWLTPDKTSLFSYVAWIKYGMQKVYGVSGCFRYSREGRVSVKRRVWRVSSTLWCYRWGRLWDKYCRRISAATTPAARDRRDFMMFLSDYIGHYEKILSYDIQQFDDIHYISWASRLTKTCWCFALNDKNTICFSEHSKRYMNIPFDRFEHIVWMLHLNILKHV